MPESVLDNTGRGSPIKKIFKDITELEKKLLQCQAQFYSEHYGYVSKKRGDPNIREKAAICRNIKRVLAAANPISV